MPRVAPVVPSESSLLCEGCGYVLDGLPMDSVCPECGRPIADSQGLAGPHARRPPAWESGGGARPGGLRRFLATTAAVLFRPTHFFRTSTTRPDDPNTHANPSAADAHTADTLSTTGGHKAAFFGLVHTLLASVLFGAAAFFHALWYTDLSLTTYSPRPWAEPTWWAGVGVASVACFVLLTLTTRVAARLTAWEARYRGLRLPLPVVLRALHYHAAHYLPVAVGVLATVIGFHLLQDRIESHYPNRPYAAIIGYHYVLGGEVVVAAYYLFRTYWIGMRNMMYANR